MLRSDCDAVVDKAVERDQRVRFMLDKMAEVGVWRAIVWHR